MPWEYPSARACECPNPVEDNKGLKCPICGFQVKGTRVSEMKTVTVRKEVAEFALAMEEKLKLNDHKKHWQDCSMSYLYNRLLGEMKELKNALLEQDRENSPSECCDVANFVMFIFNQVKERR